MNVKVEKNQRNYPFSDMHLIQRCDLFLKTYARDAGEFTNFAVTGKDMTAFSNILKELREIPDDSEFDIRRQELSIDKNKAKDLLAGDIREVKVRLKLTLGDASVKLRHLRQYDLSRVNDEQIMIVARKALRIAKQEIESLKSRGYNQKNITLLEAHYDAYDELLDSYSLALQTRDEKREQRVHLGNKVYSHLVEFCEIGRVIWQSESEAKYNDYIIYNSSSKSNTEEEEELMVNEEIVD